MLPSSRELVIDSPISRACVCDDTRLITFSNTNEITFIDLELLKIIKKVPLSHNETEDFNYYHRPYAAQNNFAYVKLSKGGKEYLLNIEDKINKNIEFDYNHDQNITKAHFSQDASCLVTGNVIGKTFVIDTNNGELIFEFPNSKDAISAVAISPHNTYIISASFDKIINILHTDTLTVFSELKTSSIVEMIQFISETVFLAILKDGRVIKIDADKGVIRQETELSSSVWPSEICTSYSKDYVYIGTRESLLYALHVETLEIVFTVNLHKSGITSLLRTAKYFIVGFKTGEIQFFNHREQEDKFIQLIKLKKIGEAIELFNNNIFLMSHRETRNIYDMWITVKERVVQLMSNGAIVEAQKLASGFLFHPKCKLEMTQVEELQPELMDLQRYIRGNAYHMAYSLIEKNPELRETILYDNLENIWKQALQKAQILLERDPVLNKNSARQKLEKFENVESKKELIELMIKNATLFTRAQMAVKNKNFTLYFKLAYENNFIQSTLLYQKVLAFSEKIKLNILASIKDSDFESALENTKLLHEFKPYEVQAQKLEHFIKDLISIDSHLKNKNLLEAMKVQDNINIHSNYAPILKLENMKKSFVKNILDKISTHQLDGIYPQISKFFEIKHFQKEIKMIMKHFYLSQMEKCFSKDKDTVQWSKTIINYVTYFDFDEILQNFYTKLNIKMPIEKWAAAIPEKSKQYPLTIIVYKARDTTYK